MVAFLSGVGLLSCVYVCLRAGLFVWRQFLRPGFQLHSRYKDGDKEVWALVTGASDGIGKGFCLNLAKQGFSIVLVSRTASKLEAAAVLIEEANPAVNTKIVVADFASMAPAKLQEVLRSAVAGLDVGLVVNNAGMAHDLVHHHAWEAREDMGKQFNDTIAINVNAFLAVINAFAPLLAARPARSGLVNVASASAIHGLPLEGVYAGSKGFNHALSLSLEVELEPQNVDVLSFTPLFVASNMVHMRPNFWVPSALQASNAALRCLGQDPTTYGVFAHHLMALVHSSTPAALLNKRLLSTMERTMRAMERKQAKVKAAAAATS